MEHTNSEYRKVTNRKQAETGILLGIGLCILSLYTRQTDWVIAAIGVFVLVMAAPGLFQPLSFLWFGFSKILGRLTSCILLCVIFYLLVSPMGLIRRALGKDPLKIRLFKRNRASAFMVRNHQFSSSDLKFPF